MSDVAAVNVDFALGFIVINDRGRREDLVRDGCESLPHLAKGVAEPKSIAEHRAILGGDSIARAVGGNRLSMGYRAFTRDVLTACDISTREIAARSNHDQRPFTLRIARAQEFKSVRCDALKRDLRDSALQIVSTQIDSTQIDSTQIDSTHVSFSFSHHDDRIECGISGVTTDSTSDSISPCARGSVSVLAIPPQSWKLDVVPGI
jgi:hypothetical protein